MFPGETLYAFTFGPFGPLGSDRTKCLSRSSDFFGLEDQFKYRELVIGLDQGCGMP
jgi:hypothetical protein